MKPLLAIVLACLSVGVAPAASPASEDFEFFERKIRPALVKHCYECHASDSKSIKGGLTLDTRNGWAMGGDSGPAIVPGKPDDSPLIQAIRYDPAFVEMPPRGRLPAEVVKDFETWVSAGAPDPRTSPPTVAKKAGFDLAKAREYWAYRLPTLPPVPDVHNQNWPADDIDRFILAKLDTAKLAPAEDAERAVLARRLYFDLVGLPPSPEEIRAFVTDRSPDAYEELVDRLLASPHFGERWGRHWLDVVRFGESITLRGSILPSAWRYRDYVIAAFNEDRPYDRFMLEQLAGDLLPAHDIATRARQRVAVSFLALGNTNLEEQDKQQLRMDVVDEQLDTIGKALLGQTLGCARCHDHKFDPIPTRDYYAMAGILRNTHTLHHANVSKWIEAPVPLEPEEEVVYARHEAQMAELASQVDSARNVLASALKAADGQNSSGKSDVLSPEDLPGVVVDDAKAKVVGDWSSSQHTRRYIGSGYLHDDNKGKGVKTLTFVPELIKAGKYEVRLAYSSTKSRATAVPVTIFSADGETEVHVNMRELPDIEGRFVSLGSFNFEANGQGFVIVSNESTDGVVTADAVQFLMVEATDKLLKQAKERFAGKLPDESKRAAEKMERLEKELKNLEKKGPKRPTVVTVEEERQIEDVRVHVRGNVHNLGDVVPRGFLQVANYGGAPEMPGNQSGRLEFGQWLASPKNPLPARVMVNRVWHWLFGAGLVRTTDNFGVAGEPPSHAELLDYLAVQFVEQGWSVKRLVREIVLSRTYRMSSKVDRRALAADPENRLLSHMNRRRLDAECIRDAMLLASGQLDLSVPGSTIPATLKNDYNFKHTSMNRSVYLPAFRNSGCDILEVFDAADSSTVNGRRNVSTVAPQALFMLNHPLVIEQSQQAASRLLAEGSADQSQLMDRAFQRAVGRAPTPAERAATESFLQKLPAQKDAKSTEAAWSQVFQSLFATIDFRYVD